ncbi:MAG: hypothetical protein IT357_06800 [Gemmatimonadaceae bacterium]|nr:hypothetical protein [Gemmatimonadaceae bacterium]
MKRTALILVALFALGCSDPLSPTDVAGRYQLERVQNAPLPFVLPSPADRMQRLLSGHLILSADGSAEEVMHIEQHSGPGATIIVVQRTDLVYEGDALVETDGLHYVRSEITTQ